MQKRTLIFLCCLCALSTRAQEEATKEKKAADHEIGVNATHLLKQVLSLTNNTLTLSPYTITYKYMKGGGSIRAGLGVTYSNLSTSMPELSQPRVSKSNDIQFRIGYERRYDVGKNLVAYAGLDFIGRDLRSKTITINETDNLPNFYMLTRITSTQKDLNVGGGPVAGIQFYLGKRVSVFTEMPVYVLIGKEKLETETYEERMEFAGQPMQTYKDLDTESTEYKRLSLVLPATIYLAIKF